MKRVYTKVGDIFSVNLENNKVKFFQYIGNDITQLNSDIIRVFKTTYDIADNYDLENVIKGEVEFYAHCVVNWGVKMQFWNKVGKSLNIGDLNIIFRDTSDYGSKPGEQITYSNNWYVWKANEPFLKVGKLKGPNRMAEIGIIINPSSIVARIQTGKYDFSYPEFDPNAD